MNTVTGKPELVVVGNGMAGMRTVEELLKVAPDTYDITVFGDEPHGNYNRIMLSPLLAGEKTVDDIMINTPEWYEQRSITLYTGSGICAIDRRRQVVITEQGQEQSYDRLLLATGSRPFILPLPGVELEGVLTFRDLQDVTSMLHYSQNHLKAVVIGGGLLGLEAANGLLKRGMDVTVVHVMDTLMERQLDDQASRLLRVEMEMQGLKFLMPAMTEEIVGENGKVCGLRFSDGNLLDADLVVMSVGIRPNIELAQASGLQCERGVLVDDTLQTFDPRIYAVGECIQHRHNTYGLVAPIWEQAVVAAEHLGRIGRTRYKGSVVSARLKVSGVDLFSAGVINEDKDCEALVYHDRKLRVYKKIIFRDNRVIGVILFGDVSDGAWYLDLMVRKRDIRAIRDHLIFGKNFCEIEPAA